MYELHELLWRMRRDPAVAARYRTDPDAVLADYGVRANHAEALRRQDFKALLDAGANPYLVYFCALQIGVDRAEYYRNVQGATR